MSGGNEDQADAPAAPRPRRRMFLAVLAALGVAAVLVAALAAGYWGGQHDALPKIQSRIIAPMLNRVTGADELQDAQTISWETMHTHLHTLDIARITLSPRATPAIWALAQAGDNILFVSRLGQFGYLDAANHLTTLDLKVDMGLEALRRSGLYDDPIFQLSEVRTFDLLSVPSGANSYDLYASHHRFEEAGRCFQMVVSRTRIETGPDGVRVVSPAWEDIYVARPCIPIKNIGMRLAGHEGGGRLALLNAETLLFSIGTHQFDGITSPPDQVYGQDSETDLGKIIEISIRNHTGRIFARGMRNPQGLLIDSGGRIWETEHGPKGGDEVNLIRRGGNYGWPTVTYGLEYGSPPLPWPYSPHQGRQDGFDTPRFAFVPSIGASNIIEPNDAEFPDWSTHLLMASLHGNTLFALKTEGDAITYAEPIAMGERMRDMISLSDGRIAIVTDSAKLILIRNADRHEGDPRSFVVTGLTGLAPPQPDEAMPTTPEIYGNRMFFYYCGNCHTTTGEAKAGPPLNGVLGREIGSVEGYPYSDALAGASGRWTRTRLRAFLNHSDARLGGTTMPPVSLYDDEFNGIFHYLRTTQATPTTPAAP